MKLVILYALMFMNFSGCAYKSYKKTYKDDLSYIQSQIQQLEIEPCYKHLPMLYELDGYIGLRMVRLRK